MAFITGEGPGQEPSHALRLAGEPAVSIALDMEDALEKVGYGLATRDQLEETVAERTPLAGARREGKSPDVRHLSDVQSVVEAGSPSSAGSTWCADAGIGTWALSG